MDSTTASPKGGIALAHFSVSAADGPLSAFALGQARAADRQAEPWVRRGLQYDVYMPRDPRRCATGVSADRASSALGLARTVTGGATDCRRRRPCPPSWTSGPLTRAR